MFSLFSIFMDNYRDNDDGVDKGENQVGRALSFNSRRCGKMGTEPITNSAGILGNSRARGYCSSRSRHQPPRPRLGRSKCPKVLQGSTASPRHSNLSISAALAARPHHGRESYCPKSSNCALYPRSRPMQMKCALSKPSSRNLLLPLLCPYSSS